MAAAAAAAAAAKAEKREREEENQKPTSVEQLFSSYLGLSFSIFLSLLPKSTISLVPTLQSRNRYLLLRLHQAEEHLAQLKSRRQEDSKANARVVEIFASHRNSWQQEERRLLQQIDDSSEEIARLRARVAELERNEECLLGEVEELKREVSERDELLNFMSGKTMTTKSAFGEMGGGDSDNATFGSASGGGYYNGSGGGVAAGGGGAEVRVVEEERERDRDVALFYAHSNNAAFDSNFFSSGSKLWADRSNLWQDVKYEPPEPMYQMKHFVARRESPWKVEGESTGVSSKLKLLEQELLNLERISKSDLSGVPSLLRKQAKRYQALAGKIDDLCRRMQASDPCESALTSELRTQRQTEFLLEACRLQQRAAETGQKLTALHTEISLSYAGDELGTQTKLATRRSLDSIRNNFKEIQRNLEIWLARIMGDLEGILASDGASRVREYYISRYRIMSNQRHVNAKVVEELGADKNPRNQAGNQGFVNDMGCIFFEL